MILIRDAWLAKKGGVLYLHGHQVGLAIAIQYDVWTKIFVLKLKKTPPKTATQDQTMVATCSLRMQEMLLFT